MDKEQQYFNIQQEDKHLEYDHHDEKEKYKRQIDEPVTLFISYTECDAPIVDIIENTIKEKLHDKIKISRYTDLQYKDSFKSFMNTIQDHDYVLTVVSDTYLRHQACMYEAGGIIKDHHYKDKLLFVVLSEKERKYYGKYAPEKIGPDIYSGADKRLEYVAFWKKRYDCLKEEMNNIADLEAIGKATEDLKILGQIYRKDMGEFLDFLADENGKNFERLYENDFDEIIGWIVPQYNFNVFKNCMSFEELLREAIKRLYDITQTDYNQIILNVRTSDYGTGLLVYADNIAQGKQRYRIVIMDGLIAKSFSGGYAIVENDVNKTNDYFCAVYETNSEVVLPIKYHGKIIGVFNSESEELYHYKEGMVKKLLKLLNYFSNRIVELGYTSNMEKNELPYVHI